jgi:hypothetical protein
MDDVRNMVQGAEIWIPRGELLVARAGAYGDHTEFARVSARTTFRRGEGLPGAVWSTGRSLLWRDLGVHFVRAEHAAAAGVDAAVGMPVFRGVELCAVVVLLLTHLSEAAGCIEIWNSDDDLRILKHEAGHYCHASEFERFSRLLQFQYDTGLPGTAYHGTPQVMADVRRSNSFIRSALASRCGLKCGVGIPIFHGGKVQEVLTLIAAEREPFMRSAEVWTRTRDGLRLEAAAYDDDDERTAVLPVSARRAREKALAERVLDSGTPAAIQIAANDTVTSAIGVGLPIHDGETLRSVVCLTF